MKSAGRKFVELKEGYLFSKQELNRKITINAVYDRFFETKRIEAFKCVKDPNREWQPHIFWDSDVAKWIEGASYIIAKHPDARLQEKIESIIDDIEKNQWEDGYINSYYTVMEPENRFTSVHNHELYCIGHLIEAAIAYFEATGRDRFLKLMCRSADLVYKVFCDEKNAAFDVPGHEEIELALYKLYKCTGNKKYLDLSSFFVLTRGSGNRGPEEAAAYAQAHLPVLEQKTAEGHSVRAMYLYSAVADLAAEGDDETAEKLGKAAEALFEDIVNGKMYITGGLGQVYDYEGFADNFYLPNELAYNETCAGIGLMYFCHRMLEAFENAKYADVIEKVFYNNVLSGLSLGGDRFFYTNPLAMNTERKKRNARYNLSGRLPKYERVKVFNCSCCPPNLNRLLGSLEEYVYYISGDTVFVNQFASSEMNKDGMKVVTETKYPLDGKITIKTRGVKRLALRIPEWCRQFEISGQFKLKDGYAFIEKPAEKVEITFEMKPKLVFSNTRVKNNVGKCCIMYGPVVYCAEGVDNGGAVHDIFVSGSENCEASYDENFGLCTLTLPAERLVTKGEVYSTEKPTLEKIALKLIPYNCFANRGESDMRVWLNYKL